MLPVSGESHSDKPQHRNDNWQVERRSHHETSRVLLKPELAASPAPVRAICALCRGAGYTRYDVPYGHPDFGKIQKCRCKLAEEREKRKESLRCLSAMEHLAGKTFETFNCLIPGVQSAYRLARNYAHHPDGWLLLIGPYGCGKTHVAAAVANVLLNEGWMVYFVTVPDLLDHLRATYAPTSLVTYDERFALMCQVEVLILDDLGAQQTSAWAEEKLFQLINYRYVREALTVITTNHIRLLGINERIRSRLQDAGLVQEAAFDEKVGDYRPKRSRREKTS